MKDSNTLKILLKQCLINVVINKSGQYVINYIK